MVPRLDQTNIVSIESVLTSFEQKGEGVSWTYRKCGILLRLLSFLALWLWLTPALEVTLVAGADRLDGSKIPSPHELVCWRWNARPLVKKMMVSMYVVELSIS